MRQVPAPPDAMLLHGIRKRLSLLCGLHPAAGADEERIFECIPQPVERSRDGVLASVQSLAGESDLPLSK